MRRTLTECRERLTHPSPFVEFFRLEAPPRLEPFFVLTEAPRSNDRFKAQADRLNEHRSQPLDARIVIESLVPNEKRRKAARISCLIGSSSSAATLPSQEVTKSTQQQKTGTEKSSSRFVELCTNRSSSRLLSLLRFGSRTRFVRLIRSSSTRIVCSNRMYSARSGDIPSSMRSSWRLASTQSCVAKAAMPTSSIALGLSGSIDCAFRSAALASPKNSSSFAVSTAAPYSSRMSDPMRSSFRRAWLRGTPRPRP